LSDILVALATIGVFTTATVSHINKKGSYLIIFDAGAVFFDSQKWPQ
jgi:hypothetical protein